eukprot:11060650-Lingulodinium_polyedra.AAC.1
MLPNCRSAANACICNSKAPIMQEYVRFHLKPKHMVQPRSERAFFIVSVLQQHAREIVAELQCCSDAN